MAFKMGIDTVIKVGSNGAPTTVVDKSNFIKGWKAAEDAGNEEITTLGAASAAKALAYLLNHMVIDLDVLWDKPNGAFWKHQGDIIHNQKEVSVEIYPSGETGGYEKWTFTALVLNRSREAGPGKVDGGSVRWERTGPITETTA